MCRPPPPSERKALSTRDRLFVVSMCLAIVVMTSNYALMATFYPIDMRERGMSPAGISAVFAAFEIGRFLTSVVAGALASRYGRRVVLLCGVLVAATAGGFIGCVPDLANQALAVMMPLFIVARFLQGGGVALAQQSMFAILSDAFPANRGLVVGSATSMCGQPLSHHTQHRRRHPLGLSSRPAHGAPTCTACPRRLALGYFVGPPVGGMLLVAQEDEVHYQGRDGANKRVLAVGDSCTCITY